MSIAFDRQQNVPRQVYDLLRDKILTAEMQPGESINERRLAEWLGVSRTPIREALRKLEVDGLIDIVPSVGTTVALVEPSRIYELCLIRRSLECSAAEQAALRFNSALGAKLQRLIDEQEETISSGDMRRNIAVDSEFHRVIHELSGMKLMAEMLRGVMGEIVRARHLSIRLPGRLREPISEHRKILEGLKNKDPAAASEAMGEHLGRSIASVMQVVQSNLR